MDRYWVWVNGISAAIHKPSSFKLLAVNYLRRKKKLSLNNKKVRVYGPACQAAFLFPGSVMRDHCSAHQEGLCFPSALSREPLLVPREEVRVLKVVLFIIRLQARGEPGNCGDSQVDLTWEKEQIEDLTKRIQRWNQNGLLLNFSSVTSEVQRAKARALKTTAGKLHGKGQMRPTWDISPGREKIFPNPKTYCWGQSGSTMWICWPIRLLLWRK